MNQSQINRHYLLIGLIYVHKKYVHFSTYIYKIIYILKYVLEKSKENKNILFY